MSNRPKALMTHYAEGSLISRELQEMMSEYAAQAGFDNEFADYDRHPIFNGRRYDAPISQTNTGQHQRD